VLAKVKGPVHFQAWLIPASVQCSCLMNRLEGFSRGRARGFESRGTRRDWRGAFWRGRRTLFFLPFLYFSSPFFEKMNAYSFVIVMFLFLLRLTCIYCSLCSLLGCARCSAECWLCTIANLRLFAWRSCPQHIRTDVRTRRMFELGIMIPWFPFVYILGWYSVDGEQEILRDFEHWKYLDPEGSWLDQYCMHWDSFFVFLILLIYAR
jgi:hypothetical protein